MSSPSPAGSVEQENLKHGILEIQGNIFRWDEPEVDLTSNLHDDLLWHIFILNANYGASSTPRPTPRDHRAPLVVTWSCSHVCRRWRDMILHSPSLWGRLIDIDFLALIKPEWQSEILRRTGESPLVVSGELPGVGHHHFEVKENFLSSVFQKNWSRVVSLAVTIDSTVMLQEHLWTSNFSNFTHISQQTSTGEATQSSTLPLWSFMLMVTPDTPWISRITTLDVQRRESMSVTNWLNALAEMPLIRKLTLHGIARPLDTYQGSAQLHLPNLCDIDLKCHFRAWTRILDQIIPGPLRRLHLQGDAHSGELFTSQDALSIKKSLSRYSHNLFTNQEVGYLWIKTRGGYFKIKATLCENDCREPIFHVRQDCRYSSSYEEPISNFLEPLLGRTFKSIKTVLFDPPPPPRSWERYKYDDFPSFLKLLPALAAVETVMTTGLGIDILLNFYQNRISQRKGEAAPRIIFPKLRTLRLWGHSGEMPDNLVTFLSTRKEVHPSLEVLDVALWDGQSDFTSFDDHYAGMKVVYLDGKEIGQHICGKRRAQDVWRKRRVAKRWYRSQVDRED